MMSLVTKGAPRACGDDPDGLVSFCSSGSVLPAHAGMILLGRLPAMEGEKPLPLLRQRVERNLYD